ncbi:MAG TPA: LysM domain-containing protein, partial [Ktedonobacterales bacterium]|nr:LysM domain-containing protein [Ktedonobacterales bacterium]
MFDRASRYSGLPTRTLAVVDLDGSARELRYVTRRFVPREPGPIIVEHTVAQGERLDNITAR